MLQLLSMFSRRILTFAAWNVFRYPEPPQIQSSQALKVETPNKASTILCVDDNEIHAYAMVHALKHEGFKMLLAHTGEDALVLTLRHLPDLVLLDINLPDINGFEVCKRIKEDPQTHAIPVVFHTGTSANASSSLRAEIVGASAFLTVPVDHQELLTVIRGCIARNSV